MHSSAVLEPPPENGLEELGGDLVVLLVRKLRRQRHGSLPELVEEGREP
jgi:hypothetical protein